MPCDQPDDDGEDQRNDGARVVGEQLEVDRCPHRDEKETEDRILDALLPGMDVDVRKEAAKLFAKQGMELKLSSKVTGVAVKDGKAMNALIHMPQKIERFIRLPGSGDQTVRLVSLETTTSTIGTGSPMPDMSTTRSAP